MAVVDSTQRLFVGISPPERLRHAVAQLLPEVQHILPHFRYLDPKNYHLTPRFLGEIPSNRLPHLITKLQHIAQNSPPMALSLNGCWGVFPSQRRARILWLGIGGESIDNLKELANALASLPPVMEKISFKPHLTVARARSTCPLSHKQWGALPTLTTTWPVAEIHLYQSILSNTGARYRIIHSFPLAGSISS